MGKLIKYIRYCCYGLGLLLAPSCVRSGLEPCYESEFYSYISFVYEYNIAYEDLFHNQVSKVDLYLFDENGVYMTRLTDECESGTTFKRGYVMGLPEAYKEVTQFVAFPGVHNQNLQVTNMEPGVSTINDLRVELNQSNSEFMSKAMKPFWHGNIADQKYKTRVNRDDTTRIELTKNTNRLRIVFQVLDEEGELDIDDFLIQLTMANTQYDAFNQICNDSFCTYSPCFKMNDEEGLGAVAELSLLRLMADRENRFKIVYEPSGGTVLDVDLNRYLNALKLEAYSDMSLQEYLDREDEYKMIIFLKREGPELGWTAASISLNDWVIRDQGGSI